MHPRVDEVLDATFPTLRTRSPAAQALRHIRRTMLRPHVVKAAPMIPFVSQGKRARTRLLPVLCACGTWSAITRLWLGRAPWWQAAIANCVAHETFLRVIAKLHAAEHGSIAPHNYRQKKRGEMVKMMRRPRKVEKTLNHAP